VRVRRLPSSPTFELWFLFISVRCKVFLPLGLSAILWVRWFLCFVFLFLWFVFFLGDCSSSSPFPPSFLILGFPCFSGLKGRLCFSGCLGKPLSGVYCSDLPFPPPFSLGLSPSLFDCLSPFGLSPSGCALGEVFFLSQPPAVFLPFPAFVRDFPSWFDTERLF